MRKEYSPNSQIFYDILEETESISQQQSEVLKLLNAASINLKSFCDILYDSFKSGLNASEVLLILKDTSIRDMKSIFDAYKSFLNLQLIDMKMEFINTKTNKAICLGESTDSIIGLYSKSVKRKFKSQMKSKNKRF